MKYAILAIAILTSACATVNTTASVDSALKPYFSLFERSIGASTWDISGKFAPLEDGTVGECQVTKKGRKTVVIDPQFWLDSDQDGREQLLMHELGHCAKGLEHNNALLSDGCPVSIMYMYVFGQDNCYKLNKQYYFNELRGL